VLAAGCAKNDGPDLLSASPDAASRGAMIALLGERLCGPHSDCASAAGEVQIGETIPTTQAQIAAYSDTQATIVIPAIAPVGKTVLIVTVNEQASNALAFEVLP
jgi:hypothetical protein